MMKPERMHLISGMPEPHAYGANTMTSVTQSAAMTTAIAQ